MVSAGGKMNNGKRFQVDRSIEPYKRKEKLRDKTEAALDEEGKLFDELLDRVSDSAKTSRHKHPPVTPEPVEEDDSKS